jgi:hypothetical protein
MTHDEIIRIAREAGFATGLIWHSDGVHSHPLVLAHERNRLGLCPSCGSETYENEGVVNGTDSIWKSCSVCTWKGKPE